MNISEQQTHDAIDWMRAADPETIISPGKIYRALGKSADCGGCMPLFLDTMRSNQNVNVPADLRNLRSGKGMRQQGARQHPGLVSDAS